jgi:hypothetical protein
MPHVAVQAREHIVAAGLTTRCNVVVGDARLGEVPMGADAYVLKLVLHGKTDDDAVAILRNCRAAMPTHAKLLIIEHVLSERIASNNARDQAGFLSDLNMMLTPGGRERTEAEYRCLLVEAGLRLNRVVHTSAMSDIVEAEAEAGPAGRPPGAAV